jgi:hypothetical protein
MINVRNRCVKQRDIANKACKSMGGTVDSGYQNAVKVCKDNRDWWNKQKP